MFDYFYKPIKISADKKVFWTSDTHFGHKCENWENKLWAERGYSSVEEMDSVQIQNWNSRVSRQDIVFHLGDFCLGMGSDKKFKELIQVLNFETLYCMPGNHPAGWHQCYKNSINGEYLVSPNKKIVFLPNYVEAIYRRQIIVMSHFPIASFNKSKDGAWMLHGHCHNMFRLDLGKCLDIGIDQFPNLASFEDIAEKMAEKEIKAFDHHE